MKTTAAKVLVTVGALVFTCVGCASPATQAKDAPAAGQTAVGKNADLADKLPPKIKSAGVIQVASDLSFPPMSFVDDKNKPAGFDVDLAEALGKVLGVEFHFNNMSFDGVLGGLDAGRFDLAISGIPDTAEREKKLDFVNYVTSGLATMTLKGDPQGLKGNNDLCGHTVGVQRGTSGEFGAGDMNKRCSAAGKQALKIVGFPRQTDAVQALQSRRVDAVVAQSVSLYYVVSTTGGSFETINDVKNGVSMGIALTKGNVQLRDALKAALVELQKQGVYAQLLDKWNLTDGKLEGAPINGAST